jgi:hypothetical protein
MIPGLSPEGFLRAAPLVADDRIIVHRNKTIVFA